MRGHDQSHGLSQKNFGARPPGFWLFAGPKMGQIVDPDLGLLKHDFSRNMLEPKIENFHEAPMNGPTRHGRPWPQTPKSQEWLILKYYY